MSIKKVFSSFRLLFAIGVALLVCNSCGESEKPVKEPTIPANLTYDEGVIINGVKWATRNVDRPGTFTNKPEDAGMFYQWNRKTAWVTSGDVTDWNRENPDGDVWEKINDPSPAGWRVPALGEIKTLLDSDKVSNEWTTENGVNGRRFTDKETNNSIFIPAAGFRNSDVGQLDNAGISGRYWCSTQSENISAYFLNFSAENAEWRGHYYRKNGFNIRSVVE